MANITVSSTQSNISVDSTTNTVTVTSVPSNVVVGTTTSVAVDERIVDNGSIGGNVTLDVDLGRIQTATLTSNVTGITLANIDAGQSLEIIFTQDAFGGNTLDTTSFPTNWTGWEFVNGFTDLDTNPNSFNIISVIYDGTSYYASLVVEESLLVQTADIQDGAVTNSKLANSNIVINGTTVDLGGNINVTANMDLTQISTTTLTASGNGALSYNNTSGVFSFTPADTSLATKTTDDLTEGSTNLYYADSLSRAALSVTQASASGNGTLSYSDSTGVFTYTPPDLSATGLTNAQVQSFIQDNGLNGSGGITMTGLAQFGNSATQTHTFTGNVDVTGNIEVSGNLNYRNVEDLYVRDQSITLNANAATDATVSIIANRPVAGANTVLRWNETSDIWEFTNDGSTYYPIPTSTSDLAEGTNLYYTDARVEAYLSGNTSTINADTIQANSFIGGTFTGEGSDLTDIRAESMEVTLKNADTVTIPKGYPVHATGFSGSGEVECVLADAGNAELMPAHFIAGEELTSVGDTGRGILGGRIQNVDTSAFTVGDTIFVAVGGGYANVAPSTETNLIQNLGIVTRIDASLGGGEIMGAGRTAATPNLNQGNFFLGNASNKSVTADFTDEANSAILNYTGDITQMNDANISRIYVGEDNLGLDSGFVTVTDLQMVKTGDSFFTSKQMSRNTSTGITDLYVRSRGSETSPTVINSNDRILETDYYAHDGTNFEQTFGEHIYQDSATSGVSTGVVPLGMEIYTKQDGVTGGYDMSIVKFRSDRTIAFNDTGTRGFGTGAGNANIQMDGTINTVSGVNATGNVSAGGITTTGNISGDHVIAIEHFDGDIEGGTLLRVYNNTGGTLNQNKCVYVSGANGDIPNVAVANSQVATQLPAIGVVHAQINAGEYGQVITAGKQPITTGEAIGTELYVDPDGNFATLTGVSTETNQLQKIATVIATDYVQIDGGQTASTPNLNDRSIFIGNADNRATTVSIDQMSVDVGTSGNLRVDGNVDFNVDTAQDNLYGLKFDSSVNKFISSPDADAKAPDHFITIEKEGTDLEAIRGRIARSGAFGWEELYEKAEGTLASPTALGNDDELWRVDYVGHDGTDYGGSGNRPSMTMRVFQDDETSGVSTGIVPLTYEIAGQLDGNLAPFATSFMSIHSDGKIVFNDAGTRQFNSKTGTANISRDGSIVSAADITSRTSLIGAGLTVAGITYPTSDGTSGQVIVTDGNGNLTFGAVATTYGDSNVDLHLNTATATTGQVLSWDGADYDWIDDGSSNADIANFLANGFGSNTITTTGDITANEFIGDLDGHVATGVYNNTGGTLTKGTPVYISGANGDEANVAPAENDDSTKMPAMGIIKENISAGASGQAVVSGVMNYSSHGFTLGADLYINDAGGLTDIEPGGESALLQKIGKALTSNFIIVQGAGRTNATPNLDVGNIFLGNASGKAVTASLSDQISAFSGDITQMNEANISRIYVGEDNLGLDSGLVTFTDLQMVKNGDSNFTSKQMSRNTNTGIQDYYVRSRGSETSPTTINSNDRIHDNLYYAHDGTGFEKTFGQHIYQDSDTGGVSTGIIPLGMEIYTRYLGDSSAPFDMSIVKFRSNRSIEFNDTGTRHFGTGVGNANITQDGTINTVSGINATGNITTTSNLKTGLIRLPDSEPANSNIQIFANVIINDEDVLGIGSSQDLELVYDGTDSIIHNKTGDELLIKSDTTDIQLSNGTSVAEFTSSGINTTGLTVASITYPATDGSNNQVLTTNGAGTLSFTDVGSAYGNVEVENFLSANVVTANIDTQGNINVNQDIVVENDVTAANAVYTNSLQPATGGGTITCQSLRVEDFAMTQPLGLNIVANSSLNSGAYVNPFKGSLVHVTGDRYGSDGAPAYWNGTNWKYLSDDANVTI